LCAMEDLSTWLSAEMSMSEGLDTVQTTPCKSERNGTTPPPPHSTSTPTTVADKTAADSLEPKASPATDLSKAPLLDSQDPWQDAKNLNKAQMVKHDCSISEEERDKLLAAISDTEHVLKKKEEVEGQPKAKVADPRGRPVARPLASYAAMLKAQSEPNVSLPRKPATKKDLGENKTAITEDLADEVCKNPQDPEAEQPDQQDKDAEPKKAKAAPKVKPNAKKAAKAPQPHPEADPEEASEEVEGCKKAKAAPKVKPNPKKAAKAPQPHPEADPEEASEEVEGCKKARMGNIQIMRTNFMRQFKADTVDPNHEHHNKDKHAIQKLAGEAWIASEVRRKALESYTPQELKRRRFM